MKCLAATLLILGGGFWLSILVAATLRAEVSGLHCFHFGELAGQAPQKGVGTKFTLGGERLCGGKP